VFLVEILDYIMSYMHVLFMRLDPLFVYCGVLLRSTLLFYIDMIRYHVEMC
jgi:hypothetical protein